VILERLEVERFGCFLSASWEFGPGLNVIRGPNEAGKSTMREAIVRLLFDNTNITTTSKKFLRMTSWQSGQPFVLRGTFTVRGQRYRLTKDFERNDIELSAADGSFSLSDNAQVNERLFELLGVQSREVYTTTACLEQQEFAQLADGKEVSELLQQTVTGTGEGVGAQELIQKLDREITELSRGLHHPAKRLGALAASEKRIAELGEDIAELAPIVSAAEDAAVKIERFSQQLSQVEDDLQQAEALKERADRQRERSAKLQELSQRCTALEQDTRRARELQEKIRGLDEQIRQLPDITAEVVQELRDLARRRDETAERAQRRAEDATRLAEEAAEAAKALEAAQAAAPASEALTKAMALQAQRDQAQANADDAQARRADLARERDAARSTARLRTTLLAVGALLVIAGAVLGVGVKPVLWAVAAVGAVTVVVGLTRRPSRPPADLEHEIARADAELSAAREALQRKQDELATLYRESGAEDLEALAQTAQTARETLDQATSRHAAARQAAETASAEAATASEDTEALQEQLRTRLANLGFDDLASCQQAAEEVSSLRDQRAKAQNTLDGILGDRTLADLDQEFSKLNRDRLGLEDQLRAPELASAEMTAAEYQELLSKIEALAGQQADLKEKLEQAGRIAERPDSDPERLRSLAEQKAAEEQRLEHLQERYEATALARELMEQAHLATMSTAADKLEPTISNFISRLTAGRYAEVTVDRSTLAPQVYSDAKAGAIDLADEASCATREQVFLAARLALTGLLWPDEPPLVLMDDPLVNFDPDRRDAALEMIRALAEETQVLLFTCQDWYDWAADCLIVL